ncbi:hypothetical protein SERLA73DRAFT_152204 [Serpula lacrymans var. lacrymans S7.3]|uniref:PH domain-containing protein n=2 Tax=Serpula lacrymans var. lacrymans TaxID=341189 RepID=F8PV07_SERL3|nr:hypothetical protein SERLA73DRAFT_152204 [Serpula lacrymans var. lacrymans S7.3]
MMCWGAGPGHHDPDLTRIALFQVKQATKAELSRRQVGPIFSLESTAKEGAYNIRLSTNLVYTGHHCKESLEANTCSTVTPMLPMQNIIRSFTFNPERLDNMSSLGDASSGIFSMYSHPMTRASSATENTEPLITPMDEIPVNRNPKQNILGPRNMSIGNYDRSAVSTRSAASDMLSPRSNIVPRGPGECDPEPIGPYFSLPRGSVQRQKSTKQLISRYESITRTTPSLPRRPPSSAGAASSASVIESTQTYFSTKKGKRRSSFSNSLRNFVSVFKKGRGTNKEKDSDEEDGLAKYKNHPPGSTSNLLQVPSIPRDVDTKDRFLSRPANQDKYVFSVDQSACRFSGTLLYLSRSFSSPSKSPVLPVWITCTVSLYATHVLITWLTLQGNPSTHVIPLLTCSDVRSLALNQISSDEKALLPLKSDKDDLKVFEVLFEGRPREKFAAPSVQERAEWVSAIWDAILQTQDLRQADHILAHGNENVGQLTVQTDLPQLPRASNHTASEYTPSSALGMDSAENHRSPASHHVERSLPPTPISSAPMPPAPFPPRISLHDPGISRLVGSPVSLMPSEFPLSPSSRCQSPSIANLGQLSVVKQRLAEIERTGSGTSCITDPASTPTQRTRTTRSERVRNAFSEIERLQHDSGLIVISDAGTPVPVRDVTSPCLSETAPLSPEQDALPGQRTIRYPTTKYLPLAFPPPIQEHPTGFSSLSQYSRSDTVCIEPKLAPLAELIQGNAAKHYDQTAGLGEQIISLQQDIHNLPKELGPLMAAVTQPTPPNDLPKGIDPSVFHDILFKVEDIRKQTSTDTGTLQANSILKNLQVLQMQLKSDMPEVLTKLDTIQTTFSAFETAATKTTLSNVQPQDNIPAEKKLAQEPLVDLSGIHARLEELVALVSSSKDILAVAKNDTDPADKAAERPVQKNDELSADKLQEILAYLSADEAQRKMQLEQQADSVRYLNELNSWLDAFVNNGTSQIQTISNTVEQLCRRLGCNPNAEEDGGAASSLLEDLRQLIAMHKDREQSGEETRASVNELMGVVREHLGSDVQAQNNLKLTNEIRGERLRFVEAMKEATAINVQAHVEQFKAELTREVVVMTQDVGRLHKEKQALEQQIADLFAFYSKQKQDDENRLAQAQPALQPQGQMEGLRGPQIMRNLPASARRRALPLPR